jgi:ribose transport system permease protein
VRLPAEDFAHASPKSAHSLGRTLGIDIVVGFAQMVVLASGGMNLAVGAIGVCAVMTIGYLLQTQGLPIPIAFAGGTMLVDSAPL